MTPAESTAEPQARKKMSALDAQELVAYFATIFIYFTWMSIYTWLSGESFNESTGSIGVFFILLTQFFMSYVPELKTKPLNFKTVSLGWLLLPILMIAIMAAFMAAISRFLMPAIESILRGLF